MTGTANTLNLALQGGGAHGAFTWGVLDRLLEDSGLAIEGISGTSAGAMNAVVLAAGLEQGGRDGAREALEAFWRAMSRRSALSPYRSSPWNPLGPDWSPASWWLDALSRWVSPYQFNPLDINPLRDLLDETIDFERLRRCRQIRLYIAATNVRSNHLRVFTTEELSRDVLLASACLPQLYRAVEIDGEAYWDGGFLGNPVLEPLVEDCQAQDLLIVQVNPMYRREVPTTAADIADRINEVTFNSSLMREIRGLASLSRMVERGELSDRRYERTLFHMVESEDVLSDLGLHSKFDTGWGFLTRLKQRGREHADQWLARNRRHLGRRSTLDLARWEPVRRRQDPAHRRRA